MLGCVCSLVHACACLPVGMYFYFSVSDQQMRQQGHTGSGCPLGATLCENGLPLSSQPDPCWRKRLKLDFREPSMAALFRTGSHFCRRCGVSQFAEASSSLCPRQAGPLPTATSPLSRCCSSVVHEASSRSCFSLSRAPSCLSSFWSLNTGFVPASSMPRSTECQSHPLFIWDALGLTLPGGGWKRASTSLFFSFNVAPATQCVKLRRHPAVAFAQLEMHQPPAHTNAQTLLGDFCVCNMPHDRAQVRHNRLLVG